MIRPTITALFVFPRNVLTALLTKEDGSFPDRCADEFSETKIFNERNIKIRFLIIRNFNIIQKSKLKSKLKIDH